MADPFAGGLTSTVPHSNNPFIAGLATENFIRWGDGATTTLSYSFPWTTSDTAQWGTNYGTGGELDANAYFGLNSTQMIAVDTALSEWSNVIDVDFQKIYETDTTVGDMRFAFTSAIESDVWGWGYYPSDYWPSGGDVWINADNASDPDWSKTSYNFNALLHEIGHALGLEHPFDESDGDIFPAAYDTRNYTIMSYTDPENVFSRDSSSGQWLWTIQTPMVYDIQAAQYLYGPNWDYNAGDTVYTFNSNESVRKTIWDGGGEDTFDFSSFALDLSVNLTPGAYSDAPTAGWDATENIGIAFGAVIENVAGGSGNDYLYGNFADNGIYGGPGDDVLTGGQGNDTIDGGSGLDTANYSGNQSSYTLTLSPLSTSIEDRRQDGDGADTLIHIGVLDFNSSSFDLNQFNGTTGLSEQDFDSFIELYIAYFNRAPDAVGLSFWGTAFADGTTLEKMATLFVDQNETLAAYPPGTSNDVFAETVYNNVLGRTPDLSGFEFWVGKLDSGDVSRDQFILEVLRGVQPGSPDRSYLDSKVDVGTYFAVQKGMSDTDNAVAVMELFDDVGVSAAVTAIDDYYQAALDPNNGEFLMPLVGVLDDPFSIA